MGITKLVVEPEETAVALAKSLVEKTKVQFDKTGDKGNFNFLRMILIINQLDTFVTNHW